jgi:MFS family permease
MYRLEWIEQLKLKQSSAASLTRFTVSPVVWTLGFTSLLTDVSAEMVNSVLPAYLVLHLHLSPLQFGLIDGVYNGFAIALLSVLAGYLADRRASQKEVALTGYGLSALCKLALLAAGAAWAWILLVIGVDRVGKGIRAAPRDALISLNTPSASLATAFSVHRALDACGSLIGPIVAFALLAQLPDAFDAVWVSSFVFAVLGISVLWLFVPKPAAEPSSTVPAASARHWIPWRSRRFLALAGCGSLLALATISDGFLYLMMQQKSAASAGFFPLFYVLTATAYMILSVPAGRLADRFGRPLLFLAGYVCLVLLYSLLFSFDRIGAPLLVGSLLLLGLYYAATEGVLMAMASTLIPPARRTIGLAIIATTIGLAKLLSSVAFGGLWQAAGLKAAIVVFIAALGVLIATALWWLRTTEHAE